VLVLKTIKKKAMLGLCIIFLLVLATIAFASQTQVALTYDPNGNLLTNGDKRYVYDGFNRLAEVFINETIKEKYWYDPEGNRLLKVEFHSDGSNTTTFYIDNSFVRIMNASGTYDEVYYYDEYDLNTFSVPMLLWFLLPLNLREAGPIFSPLF